jgi:predicted AlkP superfamily phosphohydrolase/phosphomutase
LTTTFVTGGARSGKSSYALRLAAAAGSPVVLIATAEARDDEMRELDEQWRRVGLHLLQHRTQDIMMFVFMSTDTVQHYFWQFMDENHFLHDPAAKAKFGNAVRDVYNRLDQTLGEFLKYAGPETTVFVVSDHGGGPVSDRTICLNRYLAQTPQNPRA